MVDKKIWLVGLHMINVDNMVLFGGQAISDNNLKYAQIMVYNVPSNELKVQPQLLIKPDKFFFNNQNVYDKDSNSIYSMGRDYIHKISLNKLESYVPDVGYVEYYS